MRHSLYGARSERKERLLDQLEMLEDAEVNATEDELAAEQSSPSSTVKFFQRKRPARKPFNAGSGSGTASCVDVEGFRKIPSAR